MAGVRVKCKYWDKCFRTAGDHKKNFVHPGDDDEDDVKDTASPAKKIVKPKAASPSPSKAEDKEDKEDEVEDTYVLPTNLVKMGGPVKASTSTSSDKKDDEKNDEKDDDNNNSDAMDTNEKTPSKPDNLKKRKVHEMSQSLGEDDDDDEVEPSPSKKAKTDSTKKDEPKAATSSSDTTPVKKVRMKCKYWETCYQKSKDHLKQFIHQGDYDAPEEPTEAKKTRQKTKAAINEMADGETVEVDEYRIKRTDKSYHCSCPGWKNQKGATDTRTCKHLKEYLGEEFENQRTGCDKPKKKAYIPQHITVNVLLAQKYDKSTIDPVGWWMSEKLDGVRAYWNGRCFYSRLGNAFIAPAWFTKDLPSDMTLDGELFGGRKKFQSTVSIVKTPEDDRWKTIKYHVFDAPCLENEPFEKRYQELQNFFNKVNPAYTVLCEQTKCTGKKHIEHDMKKVLEVGGEGLMIRQPKSKYERTRSHTLLKIKKFHDAEAVVIGHEKGKGRNQFVCGALRCRMESGKEFSVGSGLKDADRRKPPKIGSIITYRFQEYTNSGSPRFPTFVGIRIDADAPKDAVLPAIKDSDD